ncbi:MAG TPA: hypothetical protein VD886_16335 [Herpetosiphonaceae bacterium]|nr:hypothetical protein [Herpetosiphonaceae bacterium]
MKQMIALAWAIAIVALSACNRATPAPPAPIDPKAWKSQAHVMEAQALRLLQADGVELWRADPFHITATWTPATDTIELTIQSYAQETHRLLYGIEVQMQQSSTGTNKKVASRIIETPNDRLMKGFDSQALLNDAPEEWQVAQKLGPQIAVAPQQAAEIVLRKDAVDPLSCPHIKSHLQLSSSSQQPRWQVEARCDKGAISGTVDAITGAIVAP